MESNLISLSLYGSNPKCVQGCLRNLELAPQFYPGWKPVVWIDPATIDAGVVADIQDRGGIVMINGDSTPNRMFDRFMVNDWPNCDRYVVRDVDSRFGEREAAAVAAWIASGKRFHVMRDHPAHARPINGGMWGAVHGAIPSMTQLIKEFGDLQGYYSEDQDFLCKMVWPLVSHDCLAHDSICRHHYTGAVPFPTKRNGSPRFVGEVVDVDACGKESYRDFDVNQIDPWRD